jgi:heme/copper-type cytochrome/quinol oxidase subunit 2
MNSYDSSNRMMRKALENSYVFVRGLCRFSFRDTIKHPSKIIHRKFKLKDVEYIEHENKKWDKIRYWFIIIVIPLVVLVISFSFISEPSKFFSKSGGINVSDMKKFIILPGITIIVFIGYMIYSYLKFKKINYFKKTKIKHIKVKN